MKETWKKISPMILTLAIVLVGMFIWSKVTRTVEVGEDGKPIAGGKMLKTKFQLGKK